MITTAPSSRAVLHSSEHVEWYTPPDIIAAARRVLGPIELDPASSRAANEVVQAERYFTIDDNGLSQPWRCKSLWLNPPYSKSQGRSNQGLWSERLIASYLAGDVGAALLLVNASTGDQWFKPLLLNFPVCLVGHRIKFIEPEARVRARLADEKKKESPTHSNAIVYFGTNVEAFLTLTIELGYPAGYAWWPRGER